MSVMQLEAQMDQLQALICARKAELVHLQRQPPPPAPARIQAKETELDILLVHRKQLDLDIAKARKAALAQAFQTLEAKAPW